MRLDEFKHSRWTAEDGVPLGIYALAQTPDGFLWTGSDSGLHRFDGVRFEMVPAPANGARVGDPVSALMAARNGELWIGYQSGRIAVLRDGKLIDRSTPASDRWVHYFMEDQRGAVWTVIGNTNHPLMRYSAGRWETIGESWGLERPFAWGIAESRDGRIWVSDRARMLVLEPGERRFRDSGIARAKDEDEVLATDRSGQVWESGPFGTRRLPALPLAVRDTAPYPAIAPPPDDSLRYYLFDRHDAIWAVTWSAGLMRS